MPLPRRRLELLAALNRGETGGEGKIQLVTEENREEKFGKVAPPNE
jgi:hypothetical protein